MKFDDYSFDHYQDMWTNATSSLYTYPPFRLSTYSELLAFKIEEFFACLV